MDIISLLVKEMEQEAAVTRKMLDRVPENNWNYKPHEKSMTLKQLTGHIAELPGWVKLGLETSELDFAKGDYKPSEINSKEQLIAIFEKSFEEGKAVLASANENDLLPNWTLRSGDQVFNVFTKYEIIRHAFAQTTHHRAQLGVYLRLLNIPIPGSYGPSADDTSF